MRTIITVGLFFVFTSIVMAGSIQCPAAINTAQNILKKPAGWESFIDETNIIHSWNGITLYSGHPREMASLAPDNEHTQDNKLIWHFNHQTDTQTVWLACRYEHTSIQLIKPLPRSITTCIAHYQSKQMVENPRILSLQCT